MTTHDTTHIPEWPVPLSESGAGWRETTLGEVVEFQRGFDLPTNDRISWIYPLVVSNGIDGFVEEYKVKWPWVVTGRSWTLWKVLFIKENFWPLNTTLWIKNFKWNHEKFIYYWLLDFPFEKFNSGSGVPTLNRNHIHQVDVRFPEDINEQRAIADILSSFDSKIELLREQNETLERTAQTIFQEWFGKYSVESPEDLPEGWRVGKLREVTNIKWGSTPSTQNSDFWDGDIAWTSPKDLSNSKEMFLLQTQNKITNEWLKQISSWLLPTWTLLLSSRAPVWYLAITNIEVAINQGYIAFLGWSHFSNQFMYLWLKTNMQVVLNSANGSTFLEISKSSFRNIECMIPSHEILKPFDMIIRPIFDKILSNILQIQSLSKARDELLPRLMSGEVRAV
jgi:type I restriction enzyme, S subunit